MDEHSVLNPAYHYLPTTPTPHSAYLYAALRPLYHAREGFACLNLAYQRERVEHCVNRGGIDDRRRDDYASFTLPLPGRGNAGYDNVRTTMVKRMRATALHTPLRGVEGRGAALHT